MCVAGQQEQTDGHAPPRGGIGAEQQVCLSAHARSDGAQAVGWLPSPGAVPAGHLRTGQEAALLHPPSPQGALSALLMGGCSSAGLL